MEDDQVNVNVTPALTEVAELLRLTVGAGVETLPPPPPVEPPPPPPPHEARKRDPASTVQRLVRLRMTEVQMCFKSD